MTAPVEKHSSVPFRWHAKVELTRKVLDTATKSQTSVRTALELAGTAHPVEYNFDAALATVRALIAEMLGPSAQILQLAVVGYGETVN